MHQLLDTSAQDEVSTPMLNVGNEWHGRLPLSHAGTQGSEYA